MDDTGLAVDEEMARPMARAAVIPGVILMVVSSFIVATFPAVRVV